VIIVGLLVLAVTATLSLVVFGMIASRDRLVEFGLAGTMCVLVVSMAGFGLSLVFGNFSKPPLIEGTCYRAVRHTTTGLLPVGKVLIPTTTSNIALEVVMCP